LAISWLNLGEYATVTDLAQRQAAEEFLDGMLPGIFCIDVDAVRVMKQQQAGHPFPHADQAVASLFLNNRRATVRLVTAAGLFEPLNHARLIRGKEELAAKIRPRLEALRLEHAASLTFART